MALLVNPTARGHDRGTIDAVAAMLRGRFAVDMVVPPSADDVERAVGAASTTHDAVVVAGGDGTIHRAVCGLDGAPTPLGIVPMGAGNDFARGCGIPLSPADAARRVLDGRTRRLDLVRVNGRIYCTAGLIGVGADAALAVARLARPGSITRGAARMMGDWPYRLAGRAHLLAPRDITEHASVTGDTGRTIHPAGPVFAIFAANTRVPGGGLVLPIDTDASDGLLYIAVVPRMPRAKLLFVKWQPPSRWMITAGIILVAWIVLTLALDRPGRVPTVRVAALHYDAGRPRGQGGDKFVAQTREAAKAGAQLVVWPQIAIDYDPQVKNTDTFRALAKETNAYLAIGYKVRTSATSHRNEATVLTPQGEFLGVYGKEHPTLMIGETITSLGTHPVYTTPLGVRRT